MKNSIIYLLFILSLFVSCVKVDDNSSLFKQSETLYITSSKGAFNGESLRGFQPLDAYITISWESANTVSMHLYYSWSQKNIELLADIPNIKTNGSKKVFSISEVDIPAKCTTHFFNRETGLDQEITLDIEGAYDSTGEDVSFTLSVTPSDNTVFPCIKIDKVSSQKTELKEGGAIIEWPFARYCFDNQMDTPIIIKWDGVVESLTVEAKTLQYCWSYDADDAINPNPAILIKDGQEFKVAFSEMKYTQESLSVFHVDSGTIDRHGFEQYTFSITPALFE